MAALLGIDLGGVKVHTDSAAAKAAEALNANAFALGADIFFGEGAFQPGTAQGDELIAHELTHVRQFEEGDLPTASGGIEVSSPSDSAEREASATATAMGGAGAAAEAVETTEAVAPAEGARGSADQGLVLREGGSGTDVAGTTRFSGTIVESQPKEAGYVELSGKVGWEVEAKFGISEKTGKEAGTEVSVGYSQSSEGIALVAEVEQKLGKAWDTVEFKLNGGVKVGTEGLTLEAGPVMTVEGECWEFNLKPLTFKFIEWKPGETPKFVALSASAEAVDKINLASGKHPVKASLKLIPEFTVQPNWTKLLPLVGEKLLLLAASESALAAGIAAVGLSAVFLAVYQIANADEIPKRIESAINECKGYCRAYDQTIKTGVPSSPTGSGAMAGFLKAIEYLSQKQVQGYPPGAVAEMLKDEDLYSQIWGKAWPEVKERAVASYWEEHYIEDFLTGGSGMGNGGECGASERARGRSASRAGRARGAADGVGATGRSRGRTNRRRAAIPGALALADGGDAQGAWRRAGRGCGRGRHDDERVAA